MVRSIRRAWLGDKFDLALDFHGDIERKLGKSDSASAVSADLRAEELENEVREPIDDTGLPVEAGRGVDHSEHTPPGGDSVQVAQRAFQAAEDRKGGEAGCDVALLQTPPARVSPGVPRTTRQGSAARGRISEPSVR